MENGINIVECFQSFQGEGPDTGKRCLILRFKRCNGNCPWCDTRDKMEEFKEHRYSLREIQKIVDDEKCGLLITGGEPTYSDNFQQSLALINNLQFPFANVESNGYRLWDLVENVDPRKRHIVRFMYSPKIFSDDDLRQSIENTAKLSYEPDVYIKLVYDPDQDFLLTQYLYCINKMNINNRVFLMPQGKTREQLLEASGRVFNVAEEFKVNFSSREHIIYGFV